MTKETVSPPWYVRTNKSRLHLPEYAVCPKCGGIIMGNRPVCLHCDPNKESSYTTSLSVPVEKK